ncbi:beta-xylosidase [Microdochium trichocladiopsis]|uniref:Beta-xylosidase n=1 Tax=Microdochium trichocladiopsis TaxID=1682393 RepID=A0A9P8Y686_9PEZI|nr:beta-xylosidase [Microdochium trichocladiopsis]KAH7030732.1 beta-xylosidase [Microdochium trichocladiopsis]
MTAVNPIIPGFAPDPSVVKVGEWYYLVNSTFHVFPGLPIYASKDLVGWRQIGNVINRPEQLSLELTETLLFPQKPPATVLFATGGLYAPTIRHHNGKFYVVCTNVIRATETAKDATRNFIVTTDDIWSNKWSDVVYFDFKGIDPSLYFEGDKAWVCGSAGKGPGTTIDLVEIDVATGEHKSPVKTVWTGSGGIWPEGPHLFKREGWYYLLIAEGGTHGGHMVTMARSREMWGPYDSCPANPVLTARDTDEYIQYTGHCDAFEGENGQWWGTCLGVRKDAEGRYNMGRETFITPASWTEDGWLSFERVKVNPTGLERKAGVSRAPSADAQHDIVYIRDADRSKYTVSADGSKFSLKASEVDLSAPRKSPTFIGKRQRLLDGKSSVTVHNVASIPSDSVEKVGLAVYKDELRYFRVFFNPATKSVHFELVNKGKELSRGAVHKPDNLDGDLTLQISYTEKAYEIAFKGGSQSEFTILITVDVLDMTDPDFVGPVIGATVVGQASDYAVEFSGFNVE